ncbi:MAG: hypothetical protein L6Q71_09290 [Planctomycetes bacterium]|nr:hypothetical protein [Planctomycetota bacterium]NUQ35906.1 hypothetical protein [Planctomycetaceae bacterium]
MRLLLPIVLLVYSVGCNSRPKLHPVVDTETRKPQPPNQKSTDLDADIRLMWETANQRSTDNAIYAAKRVFNTVTLVGMKGKDVLALLGSTNKSNDSIYSFPFYPIKARALVYRFDNGAWGVQYNVYVEGDEAVVTEVEALPIE